MQSILTLMFLVVLNGCIALSQNGTDRTPTKERAREHLVAGEYYQAKKLTRAVLKANPEDELAQQLMAQILAEEIAQQMRILETKVLEEFDAKEKEQAARTWLERSRGFLDAGEYVEAERAAEKVFFYDPDNVAASRLLDEINRDAIKGGSHESLMSERQVKREIEARMENYKVKVREMIQEEHYGSAKLQVEKMLLLSPEDPDALAWREEIATLRKGKSS